MLEHCRVDEVVDHDHGGLLQRTHCLEGEQFRVTRAGTDQPYFCIHQRFLIGKARSALEQGKQQYQIDQQRQQGQGAPHLQRLALEQRPGSAGQFLAVAALE
ncbi:hypothetical protein D3C75_1132900 [compost metagenome]